MDRETGLIRTDQVGRLRFTKEQRRGLLESFEGSGQTASGFAAQHGIKYTTFTGWIQQRCKAAKACSGLATAMEPAKPLLLAEVSCEDVSPPPGACPALEVPKSKLVEALRYAVKQWSKLEVYLADGRIEIHANLVENAIRPTKLGAKNWLFVGCLEAGQRAATLYTIVENCPRLGIDTREYLEDVLIRLPSMREREAATLAPANWLRARQGKPIRKAA